MSGESKPCCRQGCGVLIFRPPGRRMCHFRKRLYCSARCAQLVEWRRRNKHAEKRLKKEQRYGAYWDEARSAWIFTSESGVDRFDTCAELLASRRRLLKPETTAVVKTRQRESGVIGYQRDVTVDRQHRPRGAA